MKGSVMKIRRNLMIISFILIFLVVGLCLIKIADKGYRIKKDLKIDDIAKNIFYKIEVIFKSLWYNLANSINLGGELSL